MSQVEDAAVDKVINTPTLLFTVVFAFISGHLWSYTIIAFFTTKERDILSSILGKTVLGLIWFAVASLIANLIVNKCFYVGLDKLVTLLPSIIFYSIFIQAILFTVLVFIDKKKVKK